MTTRAERFLRYGYQNGLFGWVPDRPRQSHFATEVGQLAMVSPIAYEQPKEVELWQALRLVHPNWRRGAQGIGDCVSWGAELCATMLLAMQHLKGVSQWMGEAATESIYGGCRVEALGKRSGGWSDGAFGASAAKWLRDWGVLLRIDYSQQTGNREHDLRRYSKTLAKNWGNFGCGGERDQGQLDSVAEAFPVQHVAQTKTGKEILAANSNGYPVSIASMAGYEGMRRDRNGVVRMRGKWPHQMMVAGTRRINGKWHGRIFQSWGDSCSGPDPGIEWDAVSACSWWAAEEDLDWIARSGDCWAFSDIAGFPPQTIDFSEAADKWYQPDVSRSFELAV